jgi:carboxypeptidase Taq
MTESIQSTYDKLCAHTREVALLTSTQSLLGWDERTKLPPAGGDYRAQQMSYLAGMIHKKQTAP